MRKSTRDITNSIDQEVRRILDEKIKQSPEVKRLIDLAEKSGVRIGFEISVAYGFGRVQKPESDEHFLKGAKIQPCKIEGASSGD